MIVHLQMLVIIVPASVAGFFGVIMPIILFDVVDDDVFALIFNFD